MKQGTVMSASVKRLRNLRSCEGYSVVDFLIVLVIISIVVTYVWTQVIQAQRTQVRSNAAQQFAGYLETARGDSMRRRATEAVQMAQVTVSNDRFYRVITNETVDRVLDPPIVVNLTDQLLTTNGPFPRTFMFNSSGRPLDSSQNPIAPAQIVFANAGGKSAVTLSEVGKATFIQAGTQSMQKP